MRIDARGGRHGRGLVLRPWIYSGSEDVGGGGGAAFWPIFNSACTNCWIGLATLIADCTEAGGECCRVGGVCELHNGGGSMGGGSSCSSRSSIAGSPSSRVPALSRTSASSPSISSSIGSSLACCSSAILHWSGLTICRCGVALRMKSMLASLIAICGRDGGGVVSPMITWIGVVVVVHFLPVCIILDILRWLRGFGNLSSWWKSVVV